MPLAILSWANLVPTLKETVRRFPLSIGASLGVAFFAVLNVHDTEIVNELFTRRCMLAMIYAMVGFTAFTLLAESKHILMAKQGVGAGLVLALSIVYAFGIGVEPEPTTYIAIGLAAVLCLLFSPYINRSSDMASVWFFNYQTGVAVFFGGLAALVLAGGMSLVLVSVDYLFNIKIPGIIYYDAWILSFSLLLPIYVLANWSKDLDFEEETCDFPKGVSFITNYIMVPLMCAYMAILYLYSLKILVQWELPRGNLGWMITGFGVVGITTKLLAYPIRDRGTRLLLWFDRYFYPALVIPILMLALGIGVRIQQYGMTEDRYAVLVLLVWFIAVTAGGVFFKERLHIKYVPMILAGLALLASFGPWGAVSVSVNSQVTRFEALLIENGLLVKGKLVPAQKPIPFESRKSLSSQADYLTKTEFRRERIRPWFEHLMTKDHDPLRPLVELAEEKRERNAYRSSASDLLALIGVKYENRWQRKPNGTLFSFNYTDLRDVSVVPVAGYDVLVTKFQSYYDHKSNDGEFDIEHAGKLVKLIVSQDDGLFTVALDDRDKSTMDLRPPLRSFKEKNVLKLNAEQQEQLTFEQVSEKGNFTVKVLMMSLRGGVSKEDVVDLDAIHYTVLINFHDQ